MISPRPKIWQAGNKEQTSNTTPTPRVGDVASCVGACFAARWHDPRPSVSTRSHALLIICPYRYHTRTRSLVVPFPELLSRDWEKEKGAEQPQ